MIKYIRLSFPTILLFVLLLILQFVPGYFSTITTTVLIATYFFYMIFNIKQNRINEVIINMAIFCFTLIVYLTAIEVILWDE